MGGWRQKERRKGGTGVPFEKGVVASSRALVKERGANAEQTNNKKRVGNLQSAGNQES